MPSSTNSLLVRRNYIATSNPFGLQEPPGSFLTALAAYDADLVIFPSTHEPLYRLARRCTKTKGIYKVLKHYPDTEVLVAHRLDIWKSVLPTSLDMSWERLLREIPEYDQWRVGNPDQVANLMDDREAEAGQRLDRDIADGADQLAAVGYRMASRVTGSRVYMNETRGAAPRASRRPGRLNFRGGGSAVFVGRQ